MVMIMLIASCDKVMRQFVIGGWLKGLGWLARAAMAATAAGMIAAWGQ
jgi:hypothetical protein